MKSLPLVAGALMAALAACVPLDPEPPRPIEAALVSREIADTIAAFETGTGGPQGPKIIGGKPVTIADNPWQASLVVSYIADPFEGAFCGGSVIAQDWVLTAAHCVDRGTRTSLVHVITDTDNLEKGGVRSNIDAIYLHPRYRSPDGTGYDFALLHLARPVKAKPIALASPEQELTLGMDDLNRDPPFLQVTGHGRTEEAGLPSPLLLGVSLPAVPREVCNNEQSYDGDINESMFCAGYPKHDSCQGDSGGPATVSIGGRPVLLGVTSWGLGCDRPLKFGVYGRVTAAREWIVQTMEKRGGKS